MKIMEGSPRDNSSASTKDPAGLRQGDSLANPGASIAANQGGASTANVRNDGYKPLGKVAAGSDAPRYGASR